MARMYARSKGQSGRKPVPHDETPKWVRYKADEVEALVVKYAKEGLTQAQIGIKLRDTYGIPSVKLVTGKKVAQIIADKKLSKQLPEDLRMLISRFVMLKKHLGKNIHDVPANRGLQLTTAKIFRLIDYYKNNGKIAKDWKFDQSKASFYIE